MLNTRSDEWNTVFLFLCGLFHKYISLEFVRLPVSYRVRQAEYVIRVNRVSCRWSWPSHDIATANIVWCMAYTRGVGWWSYIARLSCNSIAIVWATQMEGAIKGWWTSANKLWSGGISCEGQRSFCSMFACFCRGNISSAYAETQRASGLIPLEWYGGVLWFLGAALKTLPTRNGYNARSVNLSFRLFLQGEYFIGICRNATCVRVNPVRMVRGSFLIVRSCAQNTTHESMFACFCRGNISSAYAETQRASGATERVLSLILSTFKHKVNSFQMTFYTGPVAFVTVTYVHI